MNIKPFIFLACGCCGLIAISDLCAAQAGPSRFKPSPTNPFNYGVVAEGRIIPRGRVIHVFPDVAGSAVVGDLLVKVNQRVKKGDIIATLQSKALWQAQADVAQAQQAEAESACKQIEAQSQRALSEFAAQTSAMRQNVSAARVNLEAAEALAKNQIETFEKKLAQAQQRVALLDKEGEILAREQAAVIATAQATLEATRAAKETKILTAQLAQATAAAERAKQVFTREKSDAVAGVSQLESALALARRSDGVQQASQSLAQAEAVLSAQTLLEPKLKASLDATLAQARASLATATSLGAQARVQATKSDVRAPQDGVILSIFAYPGESVGAQGICEMANTAQIDIVAQVYVDEVSRVRLGADASATGAGIVGTLTGKVVEISRQVIPNTLFKLDPSSFSDHRIVLVRIALDDSQKAENVLNAQVTVSIEP